MLHRWKSTLTLSLGSLALVLATNAALATGLEQCGEVVLRDTDIRCELRTEEHCSASCSYGSVQSSCVAEIYEACERECTAMPSEECQTQCQETCTTNCTAPAVGEASTQCESLCVSDCEVTCTNPCGKCDEACLHTCSDKCGEQCQSLQGDGQAPDCSTTCGTACTASCTAQANSQCQIDCQNRVFEECEPTMVERCVAECEIGAIFCNGQYLDSSDVEECAAELGDETGIQVDRTDVADEEPAADEPEPTASDDADPVGEKVGCALHRGASVPAAPFVSVLLGLGAVCSLRRRGQSQRER